MKNVTLLILISILFFQSCKKEEGSKSPVTNYFKIGNNTYSLANAAYEVDSINGFSVLILSSPGLTYVPPSTLLGSGNYIEFDIDNISNPLSAGSYYSPIGFEAFIGLNSSASNPGNEYSQNTTLPGTLTISKTNSTYSVSFQFTLATGQFVSGNYVGPILN